MSNSEVCAQTIRDAYPEFCELTDAQICIALEDAKCEIQECTYGVHYYRAIRLYAAHILYVQFVGHQKLGAGLASLQAETDRNVKIENFNNGDNWLLLSPYGAELDRLQEKVLGTVGFFVV